MDFLMNAAKIAQEVQGGKKKKNEGKGSGGLGDLMGGFMGGGGKHEHDGSNPKPRRNEDEYGEAKPYRTGQSAGLEHKKKPSPGELFSSAQTLYEAAAGKKVDQGKLAGAASDLLDGLSMYGGENCPLSDYLKKASTYIDQYGQKHQIPEGGAIPPGGRPSEEDFHPPKPRPSKYDSEEPESRPSKPRPSKYEEEEEYGGRPQKPRPSKYEEEYGHPQKPRPSKYEEEEEYGRPQRPRPPKYEEEYDARPQRPRPLKYAEEEEYDTRPQRPRPSAYEPEESGYGGRPQKPRPAKHEEEEAYGGPHRPQKTHEDEEYGGGYARKPHKPQYGEESAGPYGDGPYGSGQGPYGSNEDPYRSGSPYGAASRPGYNLEETYGKPKKSWYE